jgi:hypothetical protein
VSKETFEALKAILVAHAEGLRVTKDGAFGPGSIVIGPQASARPWRDFFAAVREGKSDTALHFMPIYSHPHRFDDLPPRLRKTMTGKSCFHIKTADPELLEAISAMLDRGHEIYMSAGKT